MYLLFDIGGTHLKMALSLDGQTITKEKTIPTPENFAEGMAQFKLTTQELTRGEKLSIVVGGLRGPMDQQKSTLVANSILPDWVKKPLKVSLQEITAAEVFLENDEALEGLGEATSGAGQVETIVVYTAIGTGAGGARIVDRKIDANSLGFEPGHQIIVADGNLCGCGGKGHLEAYVSGSAIEKIHHQRAEDISDPLIWDEISKYMAVGLNNMIVHWSPDLIIMGGSVGLAMPIVQIKKYLQQTLTIFPTMPEIVKASLGDKAGLYGALEYLKQKGGIK